MIEREETIRRRGCGGLGAFLPHVCGPVRLIRKEGINGETQT